MFMKKFIHFNFSSPFSSTNINHPWTHGKIFFQVTKYSILGVKRYFWNIPRGKNILKRFGYVRLFMLTCPSSWTSIPAQCASNHCYTLFLGEHTLWLLFIWFYLFIKMIWKNGLKYLPMLDGFPQKRFPSFRYIHCLFQGFNCPCSLLM
jgi:hypothetical protein